MIGVNGNLIGLFFDSSEELYQNLLSLTNESQNWVYICDERPVSVVRDGFKQHQLEVSQGSFINSSEVKLREQVIRAKQVVEELTNQWTIAAGSSTLFLEMSWAIRS